MKASELRIGNWTQAPYTGNQVEIDGIGIARFEEGKEIWHPIPLTEEWLKRFGFEHYEDQELWNHECLCISYNPIAYKGFKFYANHEYEIGTAFHYVHQLQNLYFALTGQELTIKEGKEWERNHSETERKDL